VTSRRRSLLAVFRAVLMVLVLGGVAVALVTSWDDMAPYLSELSLRGMAAAAGLALLAPVFTMLGWRRMLTDLGSRLALAPAAGVFFVGQLGKYIPGSIWAVLAQAEMGARLGVPRRRVGVVGLLAIAFALLTGGAIGLPALPVLLGRSEAGGYAVVAVVVLLAALCYPPLLNWGIGTGLRLLRREPLEHDLAGRAILGTLVWFVLAWLVSGSAVLAIAMDVSGLEPSRGLVLTAVCGFALASAFGMVSVFFPAGFGIRDGVLTLILATSMPLAAAAAVAVVARFVTIVVDVLVAGGGWVWGRERRLIDDGLSQGALVLADDGATGDQPDESGRPR
jgi:glycosyltransferase 2 family protein